MPFMAFEMTYIHDVTNVLSKHMLLGCGICQLSQFNGPWPSFPVQSMHIEHNIGK